MAEENDVAELSVNGEARSGKLALAPNFIDRKRNRSMVEEISPQQYQAVIFDIVIIDRRWTK